MEVKGDAINVDELRLARLKSLLEGLPQGDANEILIKAGLIKGRTPRKMPLKLVTRTTTYKKIYKTTICKHCGSRSEDTQLIHKAEEVISQTDEGRVKIWKSRDIKEGLKMLNYVNYCYECEKYTREMLRHELERRYMNMLKEYGMRMVGTPMTVNIESQSEIRKEKQG